MERKADLYVKPTSPDVDEIMEFLRKKGIEAVVHDITTEWGARKRMIEATRGAGGPPVIEIGHQVVFGLDRERLEDTIRHEFA